MNYLAVDTSSKTLVVIINYNGAKKVFIDRDCGVKHSVKLMPVIDQLLSELSITLNDLDFYASTIGAGSFTGIRIGVSTIKALCFVNQKPCLALTAFDTLAYNKKDGKTLAVIDAGHDGFYVCGYNDNQVDFLPSYILKDQLENLAKEYLIVSSQEIEGVLTTTVDIAKGLEIAVESNFDKISSDLEKLNPLYVRKSQAEEGRP